MKIFRFRCILLFGIMAFYMVNAVFAETYETVFTAGFKTCANRVRLIPRIVEKLEFMTGRTVKVCTKTVTGRSPEHKNPYFRANVQ